MKKLLILFFSVVLSIQAFSQVDVQIGTGTTSYYDPLPGWYGWNRSAMLYKSDEINTAGVINSVAFQIQQASTGTNAKIKIYLLETSMVTMPALGATNWNALKNGATLVYQNNAFAASPVGWKTMLLDLPFAYTGTSNLLVLVEGEGCTTGGGCSAQAFNHDATATHWYLRKDSSAPDDNAASTSSTGYENKRANIIFNISPAGDFCYPPAQLSASNITANSADFTWVTHPTGSTWVVQYKPTTATEWSAEDYVTSGTYSLQNLSSNTQYQLRVKSICATNESGWNTISFLTDCSNISLLPYSESFDAYSTGTSVFPTCWTKITTNTYPYISTTNHSAPGSMYMNTASGAHNYIATSEFDPSIQINSLSAFFKLYKTSAAYNITVGVMSDPIDLTTFDSIANLTPSATSSWETFSVDFTSYTGTGRHIAFKVEGFGVTNAMYMDDLMIMTTPACNIPTGLTRTAATTNSMEMDWDATDDAHCTGWIIEYKPYEDQVWQSAYTASHPVTLSNLISNVVYRFRVKAICVSGDTTYASNIVNYGLPCDVISVFPWEEGFEDVWFTGNGLGGSTDSRPWCWYNVNGGTSTSHKWNRTTSSSYVRSGSAALQMSAGNTTAQLGDWMVTPAFTLTGNERIRFYAKGYSTYTDILSVKIYDATTNGLIDAESDTTLFVEILPNTVVPASAWTEYEINLSQFVGNYQIAFVRNTTGGYYLNIDDIIIDEIPGCARPTDITFSNINVNDVELNFLHANVNSSLWWVYYKPVGASDWDSLQVSSSPYTLYNLLPGADYELYMRTDCVSEISEPTAIRTFRTLCETITQLPWEYGFEETSWVAAIAPGNGLAPNCWLNFNGAATTSLWRSTTSADYVRTGTGAAQEYAYTTSTANSDWLITPPIALSGNQRLTFWTKGYGTSYNDKIAIYVYDITNNNHDVQSMADTTLFVNVYPNTTIPAATWTLHEVNLSAFSGNVRIAFVRNTTGGYYLNLDDVKVDDIPSCPDVVSISALSSTSNTITLDWSFLTNANAGFEISYENVNSGFDPNYGTIIQVPDGTILPFTVENLNSGQFYSFAVRQACGGNWSDVVVANTDGAPATLPYSCDFSDINEQASWKISNGNATNKFYIGTSSNSIAPITGENLYISSDAGSSNVYSTTSISTAIASRLIEFTGEGGYRLNFDLYIGGESSFDYIKVFLTDPDTTFVGANSKPYYAINSYNENNQLLTNYNNSAPYFNGYNGSSIVPGSYHREIVLPYQGPAGTVKRLIILWTNDGGGGTQPPASIDNIVIEALNCPIPTDIFTSNLTTTSSNIEWTDPSGNASEWIVKWKPVSATIWDMTSSNATNYALTNLTINTPYDVSVATVCGSDTSVYATFYFATPCDDITIPYTQNFDAGTGIPACWTKKWGATNPNTSTSYASSAPNSLYFTASNTYQYAATPPVDVNVPLNTLQVSLKLYMTSATYSGVKVGVMTDPNNFETFQQVGSIVSNSISGAWEQKVITLNGYTGTGRYIALVCDGTTSSNIFYIDDVVIESIPSCPQPQSLTATTTNITATLSWTESATATQWEVQYDTANFVLGLGSSVITSNSFETINNLLPNTNYHFYVRSICSAGDSSLWAGPYLFKTQVLNPVPTIETFATTDVPAGYNTTGWTIGSTRGVTGNPANNIYKNIYSATTVGQFTTANFGPIPSNTVLNFEYKVSLYSSPYAPVAPNSGSFIVAISTDWGNTFTNVDTVVNNGIAGYQTYNLDLYAYENQNVKVKIIGNWGFSDYDLGIDNIYVGPTITCFNPNTLSVNGITFNSANVNWVDSLNSGSWNIEYGPTGFTLGSGTLVSNVPAAPFTLTNLTPQTTYQFYVQADCGGGDVSQWVGPFAFTTTCAPVSTVPFIENFDTYSTGTSAYPSCWSKLTSNTSYPYISTTNFSAPGSLYLYSSTSGGYCHAITPMFDASIPINTLKAEFKLRVSATDDTLYVGVMTDPTNLASFELIQKLIPSATLTWQDVEVFFNNYTGSGQYIAFKNVYTTTSTTIYLDNLEIFTIPTCPRPTNLQASNATITSIDLSWTEAGSATSWNIEYGPIGFTPGTGSILTAISNPFTLTSLTPSTCYDFYVQAVCSPTDLSVWSQKGTFCTAQIPVNSPVVIDFETPSGFQVANNSTGNSWFIGSDDANTVNNTTGGQNALFVTNDNGTNNAFTITTAAVVWAYRDVYFTPSADDYTFSFDWKGNGEGTTTAYDYLSVYIGSPVLPTPSTTSTITAPTGSDTIVTKLRLQPTWQTSTHTLPTATYSGQTKRIFFMWRNDGSGGTQPPAAVDNISITTAGQITCDQPTNVTVSNISANSATVTWTPGTTETEWELDYKLTSATTWTTVLVATNPTTNLSTLLPASNYDVRVRAKCDATTFSDYSAVVNFTTTATPCDPPTNVSASNITDNSATISWTVGGTETSWQVEYRMITSTNWTIPAAVTAPTIQLQGLQNNTTYDVRVKALCNPGESAFATAHFTTTGGVITFTITASASGPGTITPSGDVQVLSGADQNFTFTPNANSEVTLLTVNGITIPNPGLSYNFSNVTSDQSIHVTFGTIGIEEGELAHMVQLYPNPTNATIEIRLDEAQLQVRECRVYDIYGKLMNIVPVTADVTKIDVTDFAAGVYFIRMNSEMGTISKKFVKK